MPPAGLESATYAWDRAVAGIGDFEFFGVFNFVK